MTVFDEDILADHQKKCMLICGKDIGFRGKSEHARLKVAQIAEVKFPEQHRYAGKSWVGIKELADKSHKLKLNNPIKRKTGDIMRLPILDINDMSDPGSCLKRYKDKISPGQVRLYCYQATKAELHLFAAEGSHNAKMSPKRPIGENKVAEMIKEAAQRTGMNCTGQGLRRLFLSTLINNPSISVKESLISGRHGSVSAQITYLQRNKISEAGKFDALLGKKWKKGD